MGALLYYEFKKILQKKITWITFLILFAIQIFLAISGNLGTVKVQDQVVYTHIERNQITREHGLELTGTTIDQDLIQKMQKAYTNVNLSSGDGSYLLTKDYKEHAILYEDFCSKMRTWISTAGALNYSNVDADTLYKMRSEQKKNLYETYGLSDEEIAYWEQQEQQLPRQFTYVYSTAYELLVSMSGGYMSLMLVTFFIAITMGNVFTEEYTRKTSQIIQCTRQGRGKLYVAKIAAGSILSLLMAVLFTAVSVIGNFVCYGPEGFDAQIQVALMFLSSYSLSIGQVFLILAGLVLLASVLTAIITMVLAEILRNSIGAMAIIVGGLFAVRLVTIPLSWRALSMLWNLVPINLVKADQGFLDLRLYHFGGWFTSWQVAPVVYIVLGFLMCLAGKYCYCRNRNCKN